jgi:hypothetical protein
MGVKAPEQVFGTLGTTGLKPSHGYKVQLTESPQTLFLNEMKTTIDLADDLLDQARIAAAERKTTLKDLVEAGLYLILQSSTESAARPTALARLQKGYHLGGQPLSRDQAHERV